MQRSIHAAVDDKSDSLPDSQPASAPEPAGGYMRYLLTVRGRHQLRERAGRHPLLAFDLDGTLAPIVDDPEEVALPPSTQAVLKELARRCPVVIVSGRARKDVFQRLAGIPVREVFGNHGIEPTHATSALRGQVARWAEVLRSRLSAWRGVRLEDKQYSLTIHYRQAPRPERARAAAEQVVSLLDNARVLPGKFCLNVLPAGAAHKGNALREAQRRLGCDSAIYLGDDETDEDVFATCDPEQVLGVCVGRRPLSRAAYYLRQQCEVELVLQLLQHCIP
jgi:trehalose 6-phosphate phosphatase